MANNKGFTFIELAVVMIVIGLLTGFGASLVAPLSIRAKRMESTEIVDAAKEAVIGYAAARNGRLPTVEEFPGVIGKYKDAWQKPLEYIVDSRFCDNDPTTGDLCTRKTTFITVRQCVDEDGDPHVDAVDAAFVIVSGGENYNNQTSGSQTVGNSLMLNIFSVGVDNVDNYNRAAVPSGDPDDPGDPGDPDSPEAYDDIVRWAALNELRSSIGCKSPPLEILNDELPPGETGTVYSAAVYMDGGVPFSAAGDDGQYLWCVENSSAAAPSGLVFRNHDDSEDIGFTTDGSTLAEASGTWVRSDHIVISGTPTSAGSFLLTVWGRDNSNPGNDGACDGACPDNCASRSFVITINP